jgi:hypothetical protein
VVGLRSMNALMKYSTRFPSWAFCLGLGAITIV